MRKRKVLVVEDQKLNRAVLKEILESEYDVLYAVNGHYEPGRTAFEPGSS